MQKTKRVLIASLSGVLFAFVCLQISSTGGKLPMPIVLQILTSRTLIGFAIGISSLHVKHWSIHGLLMGALFSLPLAFSGLMAPETPEFSSLVMLILTIIMGMIYGLLIEVITSVIFKAKS